MRFAEINTKKLPETKEEFKALMATSDDWFVRNVNDFNEILASKINPLQGIPADAVEKFKKSLEFKNGGLAHSDYSSLVDHISYKNFVQLWKSFGISPILFDHYNNQICSGSHICDNKQWSTCSSNC